ncbi:hypothetical protein BJV77DRAFT_1059736 [Russula vinacea]|nr:hypothetical protein BJV77DRAFT_1059736 [Russula vinacea]
MFRTSWILLYLTFLHLVGIYLFTRGFLLSRLSLSTVASCTDPASPCTLKPTHKRAVLLIIDSLRFDFLSPHPPEPHSPYHHNALVTGSLPTFVDIGHNFGGASIAEDSIIQQLQLANKSIAFMGDDTWLTVFPTAFHPEMSHDFDSFNVEDLHTVDNGQQQMNDVLKRVVDALDKDTLLVVLGDHGMDRKGDHGGDGDLEVSSGLWIYSKATPHRSVQQIDLVPTLSLLLGLPIPFNNLGHLDINARQVHAYLDTYRNSPSGGELDGMWKTLEESWARFRGGRPKERPEAAVDYNRLALESCRSLWAHSTRRSCLVVGWGMYERSHSLGEWEIWTTSLVGVIRLSAGVGAALAAVAHTLVGRFKLMDGITLYQSILFGASVSSGLGISWTTPILLLHAIAFLSNSYVFWEDRIVPMSAPTARLRCVRLVSISTVCREEQQPWCSVTFFSGSGAAEPPVLVRLLLIPAAALVPYGIRRVLAVSKSDNGIASLVLPYVLPPALITGSGYWLLEWLDASGAYEFPAFVDLRRARSTLAWTSVLASSVALRSGPVPVALHISSERTGSGARRRRKCACLGCQRLWRTVCHPLGAFLAPVWLAAQPSAQISLALVTVALFAHLELIDAQGGSTTEVARERGVVAVTLDEVVPLALLARLAIQWKSAFVLTPTVSYPLSPLLVILNSFGPTTLVAMLAAVRAALGTSQYFGGLLLGSALSAALLRRHLMVWKVFAPRYMLGAVELLCVDFVVLVGLWLGVGRIVSRITRVFELPAPKGNDR